MKVLKILLFAFVVAGVAAFVACHKPVVCDCVDCGCNPSDGEDTTTTRPEDSIKTTFYIEYLGEGAEPDSISDGDTIIIEHYKGKITKTFEFLGNIFCEENLKMCVTLTRQLQGDAKDLFCIGNCWDGNEEVTQTFDNIDVYAPVQEFFAHLKTEATEGENIILYDFVDKAQPDVHVRVTVIYRFPAR